MSIAFPTLLPTSRRVAQPRQGVFPESPTFQVYVNQSDATRPRDARPFPLGFLRDEYVSTYGTDTPEAVYL